MKRKLTILMFGLLLAVGWTSNAFAQSATLKASEMKTNGEYWTYEWVDASGTTQTSTYINPTTQVADSVTNPYSMSCSGDFMPYLALTSSTPMISFLPGLKILMLGVTSCPKSLSPVTM